MRRRQFLQGVSAGLLAGTAAVHSKAAFADHGQLNVEVEKYRKAAVERWEDDIKMLEERDKSEQHPDDSILFVGSSSIRRWDNIATNMLPYHAIQRGYGGAKWSDVAIFAERLISPHNFRAAVFFVGNDISGGENDKTPSEVVGLFAHVLKTLRKHNATAPVFYIAVTPTARRFEAWPKIKAANSAIGKFCRTKDNTYFLGTENIYLDGDGKPRNEFFVEDKLHLNQAGYDLWAAAIKSHLDSSL